MTNIEKITDIMEYSETGAMAQVVVMCALEQYVDQVLDFDKEDFLAEWNGPGGPGTMISGVAWYKACEEIKKKLGES